MASALNDPRKSRVRNEVHDGLGDLGGRDAGSTFGIKCFTCQVEHDRDFLPDPVRCSFSTCQRAPKTSTLSIPASSISNTYTSEKQWRGIKFEFYDALSGISGGTVGSAAIEAS